MDRKHFRDNDLISDALSATHTVGLVTCALPGRLSKANQLEHVSQRSLPAAAPCNSIRCAPQRWPLQSLCWLGRPWVSPPCSDVAGRVEVKEIDLFLFSCSFPDFWIFEWNSTLEIWFKKIKLNSQKLQLILEIDQIYLFNF